MLAILYCLVSTVQAQETAADVVTMRNGNIHVGTVRQDTFEFETKFGTLRLDYPSLKTLIFTSDNLDAQLITQYQEQLSGKLKTQAVRISRLQSPTLPIQLKNVARIDFGAQQPANQITFPSQIETSDHGYFKVLLLNPEIQLATENETIKLATNQLRFLDASYRHDEDRLLVQATLTNGKVHQGQMLTDNLQIASRYAERMGFPVQLLSRLSLKPALLDTPQSIISHKMYNLGTAPQMIPIAGGSFLRGDHQGDGDADEQPLSIISIQPFALGRFEVTFDEYDLFCEQTGREKPDDQQWGRGSRPVINVSWQDAQAYVEWLAEKTGKPYRLPSDAEWEYAARSHQHARYWWGDELGVSRANCEGCGSLWDGDQTAPVGRFEPNEFGLYDTAGNVFEWVADCFHATFVDAPKDGAPADKEGCGKRVIRGGAWSFPAHEIRSANRWRDFPSRRSDDTGFRIALDID